VKRTYAVVISCFLALTSAQQAGAAAAAVSADESARNALLLTQVLESEGDLAHPPEYSVEDRAVYAVIDGTPAEARERCLVIESLVERYDLVFAEGWTAQVLTEDSDGQPMASCPL
jgi:hypothetical protein